MSRSYNLDPVTKITAGAVGVPGERTFYLQAKKDDVVVSLLVEKTQVEALARHVDALLSRLAETRPELAAVEDVQDDQLGLEEPLDEAFRVGQISLGYDADRDLVLLECEEFVPQPDEDDAEEAVVEPAPAAEPSVARFWVTRTQVRALAKHGASVAAAGRPRCQLCGQPIDPEGHFCPALNGHREPRDTS